VVVDTLLTLQLSAFMHDAPGPFLKTISKLTGRMCHLATINGNLLELSPIQFSWGKSWTSY